MDISISTEPVGIWAIMATRSQRHGVGQLSSWGHWSLEARGHFGPFAVALDQELFVVAQTPTQALVLPYDRIIPFLGAVLYSVRPRLTSL